MRVVHKAVPCVLRQRDGRSQVLVFRHPAAGMQIAKGTVETGEGVEAGALREFFEETGLRATHVIAKIAEFERLVGAGPSEDGPVERHVWHLFHVGVDQANLDRDHWLHHGEGSDIERGLVFEFSWLDVGAELNNFHAIWSRVFAPLRRYVLTLPDQM